MKKIAGPNPMPDIRPGERQIRSFVLREGRITKAQRRALEELWPHHGIAAGEAPLSFAEVFQTERPTYLEIGFGDGDALIHMASADPAANYLGVEVHRPGVGSALLKAHEGGLENVRLLCADALTVLRERIAPASLAGVRVYFPDPWPKKRHHKRRLVNHQFAELVHRALRPGGVLHLATDWPPYAQWMLEVIEAHGGYVNAAGRGKFAERPDWRPETKFERRGLRLGHPVSDLIFTTAIHGGEQRQP